MSPGGTTASGYSKLEECGVRNAMISAVNEAYNKACELAKNSFTLIETLISITILSVVVTIFNKISHDNLREDISYNLLNDLENIFATKSYSNLQKSSKTINIIKNETLTENLNVNVYSYKDENIFIFKYEK